MAETLDALRDVLETEGTCEEVNPISWTQSVEKLLEDVELVDKDYLVSDLQAEVWVKASPQHLHTATARLVGGAVRVAHQKRVVRIDLSIQDETGCLSVCEEGLSPDAKYGASASEPFLPSEPLKLGTLDEWIVRRAIERQGGWLKIGRTFGTASCYQLNLPLAISRATGKM